MSPEEELVDEAIAAMRGIVERIQTQDIEIRNGREAAEVLRALSEVRGANESAQVKMDRTTVILSAASLVEQARERLALKEAVPVPEIPIMDTEVVERPSA